MHSSIHSIHSKHLSDIMTIWLAGQALCKRQNGYKKLKKVSKAEEHYYYPTALAILSH